MDRRQAADDRVIAYLDMTSERPVVRENDRVADRAIVPDVGVGEKISAVTDARLSGLRGAAIHRDKLAKGIVVTDLKISRFAAIFQVLRLLADRAIGVESVPATGVERAAKRDVMLEPAIFA